jgi:hypothetical protein
VRNWVIFLGAAAGLIALLVSAISFAIDRGMSLYQSAYWRDRVTVNYLHTFSSGKTSVTISNTGSGPVFLSEITIDFGIGGNASFPLAKSLSKGDFFAETVPDMDDEFVGLAGYVANTDGKPSLQMMGTANVWVKRPQQPPPCFALHFIDTDAQDIKRMNRSYGVKKLKLVTSDVIAKIIYIDASTGKRIDQPFSVVATYVVSNEQRCKFIADQSNLHGPVDFRVPSEMR